MNPAGYGLQATGDGQNERRGVEASSLSVAYRPANATLIASQARESPASSLAVARRLSPVPIFIAGEPR